MADQPTEKQERQAAPELAPRHAPTLSPSGFETILFLRADPEDLARLDPQSLAAIGASAYAALSTPRSRGKALITLRCYDRRRRRRQGHDCRSRQR